jgi:hypothetical protein
MIVSEKNTDCHELIPCTPEARVMISAAAHRYRVQHVLELKKNYGGLRLEGSRHSPIWEFTRALSRTFSALKEKYDGGSAGRSSAYRAP